MVINDEETGLISYIGKKHTQIKFDLDLYQWNMSVMNNPKIQGVSYAEFSTLVIGKNAWEISGDYACSAIAQVKVLSLSSCSVQQFTCTNGMCIDMFKRCDNSNDCNDKSDHKKTTNHKPHHHTGSFMNFSLNFSQS